MPELPEVETVRRGLEQLIVGKTITSVTHDHEKSFPNDPVVVSEFVVGASIIAVKRRAKVLLIELSTAYTCMVHLKMTGQIVYVGHTPEITKNKLEKIDDAKIPNPNSAEASSEAGLSFDASHSELVKSNKIRFGAGHPNDSLIGRLPDKSTRVIFVFSDDSTLYFNDQRKFGWIKVVPTDGVKEDPFLRKVGPEPLSNSFTHKLFIERLRRRNNTTIKAALLDQTVLAGVGNIYADESLWGAFIHPAQRVADISDRTLAVLHQELLFVLRLAIEKGGSTDRNYVNAEGKKGSYIDFARVFRRENLPCPRCGSLIEKSRVAGRGTHSCPKCQTISE